MGLGRYHIFIGLLIAGRWPYVASQFPRGMPDLSFLGGLHKDMFKDLESLQDSWSGPGDDEGIDASDDDTDDGNVQDVAIDMETDSSSQDIEYADSQDWQLENGFNKGAEIRTKKYFTEVQEKDGNELFPWQKMPVQKPEKEDRQRIKKEDLEGADVGRFQGLRTGGSSAAAAAAAKFASFEKGKQFTLKLNGDERCLTLQNYYGTYTIDPRTSQPRFTPVAFLAPCNERNKAQYFVWNSKYQLVAARRCLAPMATTDKSAYPSGNPCSVHSKMPGAGAILFSSPCDHSGEQSYQKWRIGSGIIQSFCKHGYYMATDGKYIAMAKSEAYAGLNFARFGEEVTLPGDIQQTSGAFLATSLKESTHSPDLSLDSDYWYKITNHGCWCSKMSNQGHTYAGGDVAVDEVDQICKDWFMARRCNSDLGQPCINSENGYESYKVSLDLDAWPWTRRNQERDVSCGIGEGNLNAQGCQKATCRMDVYFGMKIRKYLVDNKSTWASIAGSKDICLHEKALEKKKAEKAAMAAAAMHAAAQAAAAIHPAVPSAPHPPAIKENVNFDIPSGSSGSHSAPAAAQVASGLHSAPVAAAAPAASVSNSAPSAPSAPSVSAAPAVIAPPAAVAEDPVESFNGDTLDDEEPQEANRSATEVVEEKQQAPAKVITTTEATTTTEPPPQPKCHGKWPELKSGAP